MLSIIIPTLNEEKYIPGLLDQIFAQLPVGAEVIVSDGSSTDGTVGIAKRYGCYVVTSAIRSPGHQRNEGVKVANGKILLFLDADTRLSDGFLAASLEEFEGRKLDVAGYYFTLDSPKLIYRLASYWGYINQFILHFFHPLSVGAGIMSRRTWHEKIGEFDESILFGEDHLYSCAIAHAGGHYGLIRSKKILFNVRRFDREGPWVVCFKWYKLMFQYLLTGPIRKTDVQYEFGKY